MNNQNSLFDNGIKNSYIETNPKEAHNFLFQGHKPNNILNFGNNYINPPFTKTLHNPQNNTLFSNFFRYFRMLSHSFLLRKGANSAKLCENYFRIKKGFITPNRNSF